MVHPALQARLDIAAAKGADPEPVVKPSSKPSSIGERAKARAALQRFEDIERIVSMPLVRQMDDAELDWFNRENLLASAYESGERLFPIQAEAVCAFQLTSGLFAPVGVGWGKTLIGLMVAQDAFTTKGVGRMALFLPPQVYGQLVERDIRWARKRVPITYPFHLLGQQSRDKRLQIAKSGKRGLYVIPYSLLSVPDARDLLELIRPELCVFDEAHNLANDAAARTKRIMHFLNIHHKTMVAALSGTMTKKSVTDYHHLMKFACGEDCPLPLTKSAAEQWGIFIDAQSTDIREEGKVGDSSSDFHRVVEWAKTHFPDQDIKGTVAGFRKAYHLRMDTSPRVVSSGDSEIGTSLIIVNDVLSNVEECEGWPELEALTEQVEESWLTPNGDEIDYPIHMYKWLYELSSGFFNQLTWPKPEHIMDQKGYDAVEAEYEIARAKNAHTEQQAYHRLLRDFLKQALPDLDTPHLVGLHMSRHGGQGVPGDLYDAWRCWKDACGDYPLIERKASAVRVCPYKVNAAVKWAKSIEGGALLWVHHQEMGRWLFEALREEGIDALHCPRGDAANSAIIDPNNAHKKIVASIASHGTGKNLQHFQDQYVLQWPRDSRVAEQMLGRTHRNGQKADELYVMTCRHNEFDHTNMAACLNDALYIHQTMGSRQKLIIAAWTPRPKIISSEVLAQMGMETYRLSPTAQKMLHDKFADD